VEDKWPLVRPTQRATADPNGRFAFPVQHPAWEKHPSLKQGVGKFGYVFATANGFGAAWTRIYGTDQAKLALVVSPDTPPFTGKVIDLEGRPVVGVRVSVRMLSAPVGGKDLSSWLEPVRNPKPDRPPVWLSESRDWGQLVTFGMLPTAVTGRDG